MRPSLTGLERWIAIVRLLAVPFAVFQITISTGYPEHYRELAVVATAVLAAGAAVLWFASGRDLSARRERMLGAAALAFDVLIVSAFVLLYHFERATPTRQLLFLPLVEAAVRYGIPGAIALAAVLTPVAAIFEWLSADRFGEDYRIDYITFQFGALSLLGLLVGWLVAQLRRESTLAQERALEAEQLRDQLGQRVDVLEAVNRCARALASSLELDEAFSAFIREMRGLIPFDRATVLLDEGGRARVLVASGVGAATVYPSGASWPVEQSVLHELRGSGETSYREDFSEPLYAEEKGLLELGLRSRVVAPLFAGGEFIGGLAVMRRDPRSFRRQEIELLSLLARLVTHTVQNIRAFDAERRTVEELRRLSALRADFVSLVSHELRSPMAAVIGSARTLQQRWRELGPEQRESFLALIGDETSRLAALIADVLDTSRIEAGTFSYRFDDVDIGAMVQDVAATAALAQDEVVVRASVSPVPIVRGDRERLRQVLANLVENAVKYSAAGGAVDLHTTSADGFVRVEVRDSGPGIPHEEQRLIFEKFGRAAGGAGKPGTGLGLFIARSIAEAHGGSLDVDSRPGAGATFTLILPLEGAVSSGRAAG